MKNFKLILPIHSKNGKFTILNVQKIESLNSSINYEKLFLHIAKEIKKIKENNSKFQPFYIHVDEDVFDKIIKDIRFKQKFDYEMKVINLYDQRNNNLVNITKKVKNV